MSSASRRRGGLYTEVNEIVTKTGNILEVSYPLEHEWHLIRMKFENFKTDSDYNEKAEVTAWHQNKEVFSPSRVNLTANRGRNDVAKRCDESIPGLPWGTIVDNICKTVRKERKKGEPVVDLKFGEISESSQYTIDPFLIHNQANLLYGDGGLGKSWFALFLASLIATGKSHAGLTPEPGGVMYIDYEVERQDMTNRFIALCNGLEIEPPHFQYRKQIADVIKDQERLTELVAKHNIQFVIIDSAAMACGGKPEDANVASGYWNALNALKCTTLTIAHVSKAEASERGSSTPYGSVFWRNGARNAWEIKQGTVFERLKKEFGLVQTKLNSGAGDPPRNFLFTFDNPKLARKVTVESANTESNQSLMEAEGPRSMAEASIKEERRNATAQSRAFEGVSASEVAEKWGIPAGSIATAFSRSKHLDETKVFVQRSRGKWDLRRMYEEDVRQEEMYSSL